MCYSCEKALWLWGNTQCITMLNTRILCTSRYIWWSKGHIDSEAIHSVSQWSTLELCARLDIFVDRKGHPRCLHHLKFSFFLARKGVFVSLAFFFQWFIELYARLDICVDRNGTLACVSHVNWHCCVLPQSQCALSITKYIWTCTELEYWSLWYTVNWHFKFEWNYSNQNWAT